MTSELILKCNRLLRKSKSNDYITVVCSMLVINLWDVVIISKILPSGGSETEDWGSNGSEDVVGCILGCDTVLSVGGKVPCAARPFRYARSLRGQPLVVILAAQSPNILTAVSQAFVRVFAVISLWVQITLYSCQDRSFYRITSEFIKCIGLSLRRMREEETEDGKGEK
jgi:hypothetical protein